MSDGKGCLVQLVPCAIVVNCNWCQVQLEVSMEPGAKIEILITTSESKFKTTKSIKLKDTGFWGFGVLGFWGLGFRV